MTRNKKIGIACLIGSFTIFFFSWMMFFSYLNFRQGFKPVDANDSMYTTREIVPVTKCQLYTYKKGYGWIKTNDAKKAKRAKLVLVDHQKLRLENSRNQKIVEKQVINSHSDQDSVVLKVIHPQKQYEGYHGANTSYMLLVGKN